MAPNKYKGKILNIVFFVILVGFFIYYAYTLYDLGYKTDVLIPAGNYDVYNDLIWVGLFVSFIAAIVGYLGIQRATKGTFLRGIIIGCVIGIAVLTIVTLIMAPDWDAMTMKQGLDHGVPGIFNEY